jgi:hypothetical protein
MLELETLLAFGVGAGLVALAPMVRRLGNHQLGESMTNAGKGMAKGGIKVGVTVATVASKAAQSMVSHASEATESFMDLVAEARTELQDATAAKQARDVSVVDVSPD